MKEPGLVFHSVRFPMVERLAQADVLEPLYQELIGHERQGVTQQVYNKSGHTLAQKKEAIEKYLVLLLFACASHRENARSSTKSITLKVV
jgi:hypothetical protein